MPKLLTPIQYEDKLDELNKVRPLVLADEVKPSLDIPVLDSAPVSDSMPALGKLLRCDRTGSLLKRQIAGFENVEVLQVYIPIATVFDTYSFAQRVSGVMWQPTLTVFITSALFTSPDYIITLKSLSLMNIEWLSLDITDFPIRITGIQPGKLRGWLYGFYN